MSFLLVITPLNVYPQAVGEIRYNSNVLEFYDGAGWQAMDNGDTGVACSTAGEMRYNTTPNPDRMEFCNGGTWQRMDATVTTDACSTAGEIEYFGADDMIRFCNGANWVDTVVVTSPTAFPVIEATNTGFIGNTMSHVINLPTGIQSGDLLLIVVVGGKRNASAVLVDGTFSTPAGWTELFQEDNVNGPAVRFASYYRIADGSEGSTVTITSSNNQSSAHISYRISSYDGVPEAALSEGADANPDPPSLSPSWGSTKTLWIGAAANSAAHNFSFYPGSYTDGVTVDSGLGVTGSRSSRISGALHELEAASENPGAYSIDAVADWIAATIAIQGEGPEETIYLTSGSTWQVPTDWNDNNNTIEVIGGGGGGGNGTNIAPYGGGGGGGGGAYAQAVNVDLTPGSTVTIAVGAGGAATQNGSDTYICNSTSNCASIAGTAVVAGAKGGVKGNNAGGSGGSGGASASGIGNVKYSGGNGANGAANDGGGGGGGGAAGPSAVGRNGGVGGACGGGGGGGGANGGTGGSFGDGVGDSFSIGGNGGNGPGGGGGGIGGDGGANGGNGSNGGGGGGGDGGECADLPGYPGGVGGAGTEWDATHGAGGGGGGGGSSEGSNFPNGAAGGLYGAGGGGGGGDYTGNAGGGGAGAQGLIVIKYTLAGYDQTPDAFDFPDVYGAALSTSYNVAAVVTGFDIVPLTASVSGGDAQVRKNNTGAWGSSVDLSPGDIINLRLTSSGSASTAITAVVTIGSSVVDWVVSTAPGAEFNYFVLSSTAMPNGSLGGLAGANATCLADLQANDWQGKTNVELNGSTVKAFLCDGTSCNNLQAGKQYAFALSGDSNIGGASFTTDGSGLGPNDSATWNTATYFGSSQNFWTGRASTSATQWSNSSDTNHCTGWTSNSAAVNGRRGTSNSTTATRWRHGTVNTCDTSTRRLICAVDYLQGPDNSPNTFDFLDVDDAEVSTLYEESTVVLGFVGPLTAAVSGGDAEIRVNHTGSWVTGGLQVNPGDTLNIRMTSNALSATTETATVTLGTASVDWQVTVPDAYTTIFLTSGTSWTVPDDWNSSDNTIEVIGGGGGGRIGSGAAGGGGGGGGGYSKVTNLALAPAASVVYRIGAGGGTGQNGGDTYFNDLDGAGTTCSANVTTGQSVCAKGGAAPSAANNTGGAGGAAASGVGTVKYSGGTGGSSGPSDSNDHVGGGGGGAAGPNGNGGNGGHAQTSGSCKGGGGGGGGGGSNGANGTEGGAGDAGGPGGNNYSGGGGGNPEQNGSNGGGGGGCSYGGTAGIGGSGIEWITHGSGGGGGGRGESCDIPTPRSGGLYGGGAGGAGSGGSTGAQGLIVIRYLPVLVPDFASNLTGHWKFDEGSGTTTADSSGAGHNGTLNGASWMAGKIGSNSMHFSGGDNVTFHSDAIVQTGDWSVAAWVYLDPGGADTHRVVLTNGDVAGSGKGGFQLLVNQDNNALIEVQVGLDSQEDVESNIAPSTGAWHHLAATKSGTSLKLYIDGVLDNSGTLSTATMDYNMEDPLTVAGQHNEGGDDFEGRIDDLRLYDRALSAADVAALYAYTGAALVHTAHVNAKGDGDAPVVSASFTPPNNSLLVVAVGGRAGASGANPQFSVSGGGLTWTERIDATDQEWNSYGAIFTAPVTTGASMTVTVTANHAADSIGFSVSSFTGYNTSSPFGATLMAISASPRSGAYSANLSAAPAASSYVISVAVSDETTPNVSDITTGAGWTQIYEAVQNTLVFNSQYRTGSTSQAVDFAAFVAGENWNAMAIEIKAAP